MHKAIEIAKESEQNNGMPIGAILVKDGEIVATGESSVWPDKDPSGHGESNCIRSACKKLNDTDLEGYILYGTLEPCGMCMSTAAWANLSEVYFGAYREDVLGNNYEIDNWSSEEASKNMHTVGGNSMSVTGGILREECTELLKDYVGWEKK